MVTTADLVLEVKNWLREFLQARHDPVEHLVILYCYKRNPRKWQKLYSAQNESIRSVCFDVSRGRVLVRHHSSVVVPIDDAPETPRVSPFWISPNMMSDVWHARLDVLLSLSTVSGDLRTVEYRGITRVVSHGPYRHFCVAEDTGDIYALLIPGPSRIVRLDYKTWTVARSWDMERVTCLKWGAALGVLCLQSDGPTLMLETNKEIVDCFNEAHPILPAVLLVSFGRSVIFLDEKDNILKRQAIPQDTHRARCVVQPDGRTFLYAWSDASLFVAESVL